jgi:tagaturonate reductase
VADFPILQFGTSRFLQAHADLFVSEALARGEAIGRIAVVGTTASPASRKRVSAFAKGRPYPVQIKGLENGALVDDVVQVDSVGAGVDANDNWAEVERLFCAARVVVSNTGDRGYERDPAEAFDDVPPKSFPAKIAKLLIARHRAGAPPLTFLPCELTSENGTTLRGIVRDVLQSWSAPKAVEEWAHDGCLWGNSLVDRIVSTPLEPLGAIAEPYALWAIESQAGLDLPCRHEAIVVTDNLARYERLKLFILNLGHTFLAQVWKARGGRADLTVREAMQDPHLRPPLDALYDEDVLPIFAALGMTDEAQAYRRSVVERFSNPFLDHRMADIYVNHAAKARRRYGGLIALAESDAPKANLKKLKALLASAS